MHKHVRPATEADVRRIAPNLKPDDRAELEALYGPCSTELLLEGFRLADKVLAWAPDGYATALFGVQGDGDVGIVFALSTPEIFIRWRDVHRATPAILDELGSGYAVLSNVKDARHKHHIRWLRALGFTFFPPTELGPNRLLVHEFVRINK